jgi:hypothetical protein
MKINIIGMRLDFIQGFGESIYFDKIGLSLRLRAKGTGQVTYACNFNIGFFEFFHPLSTHSISINKLPAATKAFTSAAACKKACNES